MKPHGVGQTIGQTMETKARTQSRESREIREIKARTHVSTMEGLGEASRLETIRLYHGLYISVACPKFACACVCACVCARCDQLCMKATDSMLPCLQGWVRPASRRPFTNHRTLALSSAPP